MALTSMPSPFTHPLFHLLLIWLGAWLVIAILGEGDAPGRRSDGL